MSALQTGFRSGEFDAGRTQIASPLILRRIAEMIGKPLGIGIYGCERPRPNKLGRGTLAED